MQQVLHSVNLSLRPAPDRQSVLDVPATATAESLLDPDDRNLSAARHPGRPGRSRA